MCRLKGAEKRAGMRGVNGKVKDREDVLVYQTEDGIRDSPGTGVQACALPILVTVTK
mgnify:CR=1 FL=1